MILVQTCMMADEILKENDTCLRSIIALCSVLVSLLFLCPLLLVVCEFGYCCACPLSCPLSRYLSVCPCRRFSAPPHLHRKQLPDVDVPLPHPRQVGWFARHHQLQDSQAARRGQFRSLSCLASALTPTAQRPSVRSPVKRCSAQHQQPVQQRRHQKEDM